MSEETYHRISVSLNDQDLANLQQIGKDVGVLNRSATIRFLIRYFQRTEATRQCLTSDDSLSYNCTPEPTNG
jgi:metal-responsive CopG/Arc/MetJ family transcriptional regulator